MKEWFVSGMAGLLLGIALQRLSLADRAQVRLAAALRSPGPLRRMLHALGAAMLLIPLLMWLAVIDVDTLPVPPLHAGTVLGGVLFGAALGWSGITPATAPVIAGAGRFLEGMSAMAGCAAGAALAPVLSVALQGGSLPGSTLFRVTLDRPHLFPGGFLAQGMLGLALIAAGLLIRAPHQAPPPPEPPSATASDQPEDVQEETFVASLPGEEPVVVDTQDDQAP